MKKKQSRNSTDPIKDNKSIESKWRDSYEETFSFVQKPVNLEWLRNLIIDLIKWAKTCPEALRIDMFFADRGIPMSTYYKWRKTHEFVERSHTLALRLIGMRRERGAIYKEFDSGMIRTTMHHFMEEFKHDEEWRAKLKTSVLEEENGTKYVVVPVMPATDIVKEKKNDK